MTTVEFIAELFYHVDNTMPDAPKHSQANLSPSEVVTIAIRFVRTPPFELIWLFLDKYLVRQKLYHPLWYNLDHFSIR